jgi:hypothetical protein
MFLLPTSLGAANAISCEINYKMTLKCPPSDDHWVPASPIFVWSLLLSIVSIISIVSNGLLF